MRYRIKENQGKFIIEVCTLKIKGFLWKRRVIEIWSVASVFGDSFVDRSRPSLRPFSSLDKAMDYICKLNYSTFKYHYLT